MPVKIPSTAHRSHGNEPTRAAGGLALLLGSVVLLGGCGSDAGTSGAAVPSADNGRLLLRQFGCGQCHRIPGVAEAKGKIAPPLEDIGRRVYIAGRLANTPENMARFIREPQAVKPGTAMPDLGVSESHARDMVAYLQTLRK